MKRTWVCLSLLTLVFASAAQSEEKTPPPGIACLGQVVPGERVIRISAPEASVVKELKVRRGEIVQARAILAVLRDYDTAQAALKKAEASVALARARLDKVKAGEREETVGAQEALIKARQAEVDFLLATKNRHQQLHEEKLVSSDQFEEISQRLAVAEAELKKEQSVRDSYLSGRKEDIAIEELNLAVAQAEHAEAAASLENQLVRAPFAGEILDIHTYAGERMGENGLADLGDTSRMMVRAEVYETDIARVQLGSRATIRIMMKKEPLNGQVVEIERQISSGRIYALDSTDYTDRRIVLVRIQPDNPQQLAPYSHAHATVMISAP